MNAQGHLRRETRSPFLTRILFGAFFFAFFLLEPLHADQVGTDEVLLRPGLSPAPFDRVEVTYDADGKLTVREGGKVQTVPLKVQANFVFFERRPEVQQEGNSPGQPLRVALRWYEKAEASGSVDQKPITSQLRSDRRLVALKSDSGESFLWSLSGPFTRSELDLLRPTVGTIALEDLLPPGRVQKGSKWKVPGHAVGMLVGFEGLASSDVEATLLEIVGDIARVELEGKAEGAAEAMSSSVSIKARYQFSLSQGRIIWFGMAYHERRDPGPIAPGVDVVTKLAITLRPEEQCSQLADLRLVEAALNPRTEDLLLEEESPGRLWRLHHDRRWHLTAHTEQFSVFRYVDRGSYLAQCKIARAQRPQPGMTLAQFQADIRDALGKQFHRFVHASELRSMAGTPIYRVEAQGLVGDVPVMWIFYWVASPRGEAIVLSFTVEQSLYERFAEADKQFLDGLKFRIDEVAARPR